MSYDYNYIIAMKNLLVSKGIITEEEYREEVLKVTYELSQARKIESARISFEEWKIKKRIK